MTHGPTVPELERGRTSSRRWSLLSLLLCPMGIVLLSAYQTHIRGPFYLDPNCDPDYVYLLNAALVAQGGSPWHVDHPGTPVQVFGAVTIRATHLVAGRGPFMDDILDRSEFYLHVLTGVTTALFATTLLLAGVATLQITGSTWLALAMQVGPWLGVNALTQPSHLNPEAMLLSVVTALGLVVLACVYRPEARAQRWCAVGMGLLVGLAIACKLSAIPLLLLPLVLLRSWRNRAIFLVLVPTAFFIATLPAISQLSEVVRWTTKLSFESRGGYGTDPAGLLSVERYLHAAEKLLRLEPAFFLTVAACGVVLLRMWPQRHSAPMWRGLLAVLVTLAACIALVIKHPQVRHLTPAMALLGTAMCLSLASFQISGIRWRSATGIACIVIALCIAAVQAKRINDRHKGMIAARAEMDEIQHAVERLGGSDCQVIMDYPSYSRRCTLFRAAMPAGSRVLPMAMRDSESLFYSQERQSFFRYAGPISVDEALSARPCTLLVGYPYEKRKASRRPIGVRLEPLFENGAATVYRVWRE